MLPADLARLHKYLLEIEHSDHISDETRRGRKRVAGTQAAAEKAAALTTAIAGECLMSKRPSPPVAVTPAQIAQYDPTAASLGHPPLVLVCELRLLT